LFVGILHHHLFLRFLRFFGDVKDNVYMSPLSAAKGVPGRDSAAAERVVYHELIGVLMCTERQLNCMQMAQSI
jgi:hypothetical protein